MIDLGTIVILRSDPSIGGIVFAHHGSYVGVEFGDHRLAWLVETAVEVVEKRDEGEVAFG